VSEDKPWLVEQNKMPRETFYDGYVVNAIIDACYKSEITKKWEPVELNDCGEKRDFPAISTLLNLMICIC